eukprot:scaffold148654_cov27-Attheya_sp.AAC.1
MKNCKISIPNHPAARELLAISTKRMMETMIRVTTFPSNTKAVESPRPLRAFWGVLGGRYFPLEAGFLNNVTEADLSTSPLLQLSAIMIIKETSWSVASGHEAPISSDKVLAGQEKEKKHGLIGKEGQTFAKRLAGLLSDMATSIFASLRICECKTKHRTRPSNPPLLERLPGPSTPH